MPGAKRRNFFRAPPYFVFTSTIVLVSAFVIGQYSFVIFLFFLFLYSQCLRSQSFLKVGARALCPMESATLSWETCTPKSMIKPKNINGRAAIHIL